MKKFIKLLAVALAAAALAGCSLVSINTEKITVATVGEDTITKAAFDEGFNAFLAQYGYTQDSTEIADQLPDLKEQYINMMVQNLVIEQKIEELGLGEVTDEEKAAAEQSVQDWYDEQLRSWWRPTPQTKPSRTRRPRRPPPSKTTFPTTARRWSR